MVVNATFNNISVIFCRSVLLVEESQKKQLINFISSIYIELHLIMSGIQTHNFSVALKFCICKIMGRIIYCRLFCKVL